MWIVCLGCRNATAFAAADEALLLAADLIIQPDAMAVITRDKDGGYHVTTSHHPVTKGASWGLFWGSCSACCSSSRTRSDQSVTSGAPPPAVHVRPDSRKVVRPVAPSVAPGRHTTPCTLTFWPTVIFTGVRVLSMKRAEVIGHVCRT